MVAPWDNPHPSVLSTHFKVTPYQISTKQEAQHFAVTEAVMF